MKLRIASAAVLASLTGSLWLLAQVKDFRPITEAMLRNPSPNDWIVWRRTDSGWGYSPLDQIKRDNVQRLQQAWSWVMEDGAQEPTPLVYDGVMYLPNPHGVIQALDASTGDLLWEYRPKARDVAPPSGSVVGGVQRNIAIFGDRIFATTNDAHIIALEARTGKLVWDSTVADSKLGYGFTSGPIVVRGKVIAGVGGCNRYKEDVCFITGYDAATGREAWRTSTIARPGEPGGESWGDLPLRFRAGGDAWIPGSYDPETNLIYWATAQAKPWARAVRGTDGDALYTNSTLALNPDTGKLSWYYQHLRAETHDMDEVFESVLIDLNGRKSLFKMGKLGILWQLDRVNGTFVHATDIGYQNLVEVGPESGRVTYRPEKIPKIGVEVDMCPSTAGLKDWRAMAYSPQTTALYIPIELTCERATFNTVERELGKGGNGPVRRIDYKHPAGGGNLGEFLALELKSGKIMWRHRVPSPMNTAALTTAGGLAFSGDWDRHLYAYDAATGKILWQTRTLSSPQGFPISYMAKGKQYIAVPVGTGGGSWGTSVPASLAKEIRPPKPVNAMLVYAMP